MYVLTGGLSKYIRQTTHTSFVSVFDYLKWIYTQTPTTISNTFLHPADKYEKHGADKSYGKPDKNLCKRMLTQYDAACADCSGEQQQSAKRPYRVEIEQIAESNNTSRQSARAHHVCADFPPSVNNDA